MSDSRFTCSCQTPKDSVRLTVYLFMSDAPGQCQTNGLPVHARRPRTVSDSRFTCSCQTPKDSVRLTDYLFIMSQKGQGQCQTHGLPVHNEPDAQGQCQTHGLPVHARHPRTVSDSRFTCSCQTPKDSVRLTVYLFMPDAQGVRDLVHSGSDVLTATPQTEQLSAPCPTNG